MLEVGAVADKEGKDIGNVVVGIIAAGRAVAGVDDDGVSGAAGHVSTTVGDDASSLVTKRDLRERIRAYGELLQEEQPVER